MASSAIKYETRKWPVSFKGSVFAGDPSPELDAAWHNLFEGRLRPISLMNQAI